MIKICAKCNIEKPLSDYGILSQSKDKLHYYCKTCKRALDKEYAIKNKEKIQKYKKEYRKLNIDKLKAKCKVYRKSNAALLKQKRILNKEQRKIWWDEWYKLNKESQVKKNHENYLLNKKLYHERSKLYQKKRRAVDGVFDFRYRVSVLVRDSFKRTKNGGYRKSAKTEEIIGCTISFLIERFQSLFAEGMSFENNGEWHIDHIIPLATAKTKEDIIRLNHYTNLQPLWAKDNLRKGASLDYVRI